MGPWYYEVVSFDGDYVNLRRTDIESDELNPVALALLPPEIEVGSKVKCEYFQYEVIGEPLRHPGGMPPPLIGEASPPIRGAGAKRLRGSPAPPPAAFRWVR